MEFSNSLFKFVIVLIITFASFGNLTRSIQAQEVNRNYFGIIINPAIIFLEADPGETLTGKVQLRNDFQERNPNEPGYIGESKITYYPDSLRFEQSEIEGKPKFIFDSELPYESDSSQWVSFFEESYIIDFEQTVESNYTVTVPSTAKPGGHYMALTYNENKESGDDVALTKSIAALVFLTVKGESSKSGNLLEFYTGKKWYEFTPVDFHIKYQNEGTVHDVLGGNIFVHKGDITKPVATLTVNESATKVVLPGTTRDFVEIFNNGFITFDDKGKPIFDFKKLTTIYFGKYHATLKLKHDENGERVTTEANLTYWVIPWRLILVIIILILMIITFFLLKRKITKRSKVKYVDKKSSGMVTGK